MSDILSNSYICFIQKIVQSDNYVLVVLIKTLKMNQLTCKTHIKLNTHCKTRRILSILQNNTTFRFFFIRLCSVCTAMLLIYRGRLVTSQQKCRSFCPRFIFACRLVWYLYACAVGILKFQNSVYSHRIG